MNSEKKSAALGRSLLSGPYLLWMVGFTLILESFDIHVPKGYIYFAMFFSIAVESLNLIRNKKNPL